MQCALDAILDLDPLRRVLFVAATGISLYTLFDFGYTLISAVALTIMHGVAAPSSSSSQPGRVKSGSKAKGGDRLKQLRSTKQGGKESEGTETETDDESSAAYQARTFQHQQLSLRNIDFFPLLNPAGLTQATTVHRFWSYAWHRLLGRPFGVYGILPFTYVAYLLQDLWQGKWNDPKCRQPALAFRLSPLQFVPLISGAGEFSFFFLNVLQL
ncbi:uncharacterized protein UHOR_02580 [Ustilago hordei]|uniref:Uncharacterized protein n=1 Tax=Ustilago hordei TaxID=120017 RepID=I2G2P5_USTHO|nr:hypothetical protein NDA15_004987 [Ustilago hordei]KAJ1587850.1 hypothetical protein NDA12_001307 [Ustilago hordei]CCF53438.1 uncharacterized protein UHOR_02580 [Ustilago hordei]